MTNRTIPYPVGVTIDRLDGVGFQCPCDPDGDQGDTYIAFRADVLADSESFTCGGCGRTYVYRACITEYLEIEGDNWRVQL